jgi:hypothetical protein
LEIEETESRTAYRQSVRYSRTETDLVYIDALTGAIPSNRVPDFSPPRQQDQSVGDGNVRVLGIVLSLAVILAFAFLFWRYGGASNLTLRGIERSGASAKSSGDGALSVDGPELPLEEFLGQLHQMSDKRQALNLLVGRCLRAAAGINALRLTRSDTAREILRRLPQKWALLADLTALVRTGEHVQYGGHPIDGDLLETAMGQARPILESQRS